MKKVMFYLLALSLFMNIMLLVIMARGLELPAVEAINYIKEPGTYGPPAMEIIDQDVIIHTANVILQNTFITGNLLVTADSNGTINLNRVQVQGEVIVSGDADVTLVLVDCSLVKIAVLEREGATTIVAQGTTKVDLAALAAETTLREEELTSEDHGFGSVRINTLKNVTLHGDFDLVDIGTEARLRVSHGSIAALNIPAEAANTQVELNLEARVERLAVGALFTLLGEGSVHTTELGFPGLIALQGTLEEVYVQTGGIYLELGAGTINKLVVPALEHPTSISLAEDAGIDNLELNARTGITGKGYLGTVVINSNGVVIEQTPETVVIEEGLTATINGQEYKLVKPKTPLSMNSLSGMSLLVNNSGSRDIVTTPAGAAITARSSNTNVATVTVSGNRVTVTARRGGTATITVTGNLEGYTSTSRSFSVTVNNLSDVKTFTVNDGISVGKKMVFVELYDPNPSKYTVRVGDVTLKYMASEKKFYGEVNTTDAKKSNVKVTQ